VHVFVHVCVWVGGCVSPQGGRSRRHSRLAWAAAALPARHTLPRHHTMPCATHPHTHTHTHAHTHTHTHTQTPTAATSAPPAAGRPLAAGSRASLGTAAPSAAWPRTWTGGVCVCVCGLPGASACCVHAHAMPPAPAAPRALRGTRHQRRAGASHQPQAAQGLPAPDRGRDILAHGRGQRARVSGAGVSQQQQRVCVCVYV
jgi:hypothetical protein